MEKKRELALGIVRRLQKEGFCAYWVGGCVRDMLMRRKPQDFDIATNAGIEQIRKIFPRKTHPVGARFGTLILVQDKIPFQITTFRGKNKSASRSLEEDIALRDFTINALAYEPLEKKMVDLVGARRDIRKKIIRTIGRPDAVFKADPLRLLRAARFAAALGFKITPETLQGIKRGAGLIRKVSRERIRDELILILTSRNPALGLELLDKTGLLKLILPEVHMMKGVSQPAAFHPEGDVYTHTLLMLKQLKNPSTLLAFACLLHDIGKPQTFQMAERIRFSGHDKAGARMTDRILTRLKFAHRFKNEVTACVDNHMRMMEAPKMRESTLKRMFSRPTFAVEMQLHYIDCLASHKDFKVWRFLKRKYRAFLKQPVIPGPLLRGRELIKMGFTPGPIFGKIIRAMVDRQLEGRLNTKNEARKWVREKFKT